MAAPFAALEADLSTRTLRALADVEVVRQSNGLSFLAIRGVADRELFERHAIAAECTLRYLTIDAPGLMPGEALTIDGVVFRVLGDPVALNASEALAQIAESA